MKLPIPKGGIIVVPVRHLHQVYNFDGIQDGPLEEV